MVACTYTRQHSRARIPGTCAAALNRAHTENADIASEFLCAEGEVATSSCVPAYCGHATSPCVTSNEDVQGLTLCGATCAGVALQGFDDEFDSMIVDDEFPMGIPDGTEGTVTLAIAQQGAEMTDEMCTAACAIAEAACMDVRSRAHALSL